MRARALLLLLLTCLGYGTSAQGASFDCGKAQTKVETMICENDQLTILDENLNGEYESALQKLDGPERKRLVSEQRRWLKTKRDACRDEACLAQVYTARMGELDPFADKKITCEEMRKYPGLIFGVKGGIDLGSGSGSPIDFDYSCEESLASLPYLTTLSKLADTIRGESGPQICTGSIVYAHWRYHQYDLAQAGIAPRVFLKSVDPAGEAGESQYFQQWSWESPYNYLLERKFSAAFDKALPELAEHYRHRFGFSAEQSREIARHALMLFVQWAAGTYPEASLKAPSMLARLAADEHSTVDRLRYGLELEQSGPDARNVAYQALKVALLHDRPQAFVSILANAVGRFDGADLDRGDESVLFFALPSARYVEFLLDRGASIDYQNSFGKTPLFYAIGYNDHKTVDTLLRRGADPNHAYKTAKELNPYGIPCGIQHTRRTPLMHAAQNSDVEMLGLLLAHGARLGDRDELGFTALDYAVLGKKPRNQIFLAGRGLKLGTPRYPRDQANRPVALRPLVSEAAIPVNGSVNQLKISAGRPDVLVASVIPSRLPAPGPEHGLYLYSISGGRGPRLLGRYGGIRVQKFALSADGKTAYVMNTWFRGLPTDRKYGLYVIDVSDPKHPTLAAIVEGDFMVMHRSLDGKYLYLQERNQREGLSRGILVYSLAAATPSLLCANPFGEMQSGRLLFSYGFATFVDAPLLAIQAQTGGVYLYDVADPCHPKVLAKRLLEKEQIDAITGYSSRTIFANKAGLASYKLTDPPQQLYRWSGSFFGVAINDRLATMAAAFGQEVALLKLRPDGGFSPIERYEFASSAWTVALSDSGTLYVGTKNGIISTKTACCSKAR